MAKYEHTLTGDFDEVLQQLENDISGNGISMNLVDASTYSCGDINIVTRVYDKFFMRNKSRASLSLTIVDDGMNIFVSAIGAGGGQGAIFNFDWGIESEMVAIVKESLNRINQTSKEEVI
ncbi:DUF6054 family protein [Tindallia californiensis]|uniref:Uncharacterized protein n=1 Tax=Tindallia californiensis TaxID=159292 RepID=A0A1H3QDR6_9FIRM|nr:DUF6054 family protein [Tindallia californiensis]SDZ11145.1 hypothetical protein SAMN05192546_1095 [Tindallia californiensis]